MTPDRREAAIEAAAEVLHEHGSVGVDPGTPRWNVVCVCGEVIGESGDDDIEARHDRHVARAVLALGCDCAERLDAEAERELRTTHPRQSGKREALDRAVRLHDAAEFLKSNPAGVNVTAAARMGPPSSEGRPMTGAPLDADEAVPAPAGSPAEDGANDSRGIPPEPPPDARGSDLTASEAGEAVGEGRESAGPGDAQ